MAIPIVKIKWDEAVNAPPFYQVIRYRQSNPSEYVEFTPVASGEANYEFIDNAITEPAYYNKLWSYRVTSLCADEEDRPFMENETIVMTCAIVFSATATDTTIAYQFSHLGGDINKYTIKILNAGGTEVATEQIKTPPFSTPITGIFSGLTGNTTYTIKVISEVDPSTYTKECTFTKLTEPSNNHYSIQHTNGNTATNVKLYIGQNNTTPVDLIYDGPYPLTGIINNTSSFLPAVDANVKLMVTNGTAIVTGSCNGTSATPTGAGTYTMQWSGMNGDLVLTYTSVAMVTANWSMDRLSAASNTYGKLVITVNGVGTVNNTVGGYAAGSFSAAVGSTIVASVVYSGEPGTQFSLLVRESANHANILFNAGGAHATLSHTFAMPNYTIDIIGIAAVG